MNPLQQAITDLESSRTTLQTTTTTQANAQQKADAAAAALTQANSDENNAIVDFNAKCDALIAAVTAAKIPVPGNATGTPASQAALPAAAGS